MSSDPGGLDAIYRQHGAAVFRRARQILGHDADAYEVVQDVFLALLQNPDQFRATSALTTYLYSATTHACLNRLRNQKNRARLRQRHFATSEATGVRALTPEQTSLLHQAIQTMPDDLCQVLIYYALDGLTHEEIAQVMKCSRRHVGDMLARIVRWNNRDEVTSLETLRQNQSEACVSDLRLDRWHAGELDAAEITEIERHLQHCDVCRARHSELETQAAAFLDQVPTLESVRHAAVAATGASRSRPWRWGAAAAVLATAAAVILVTHHPGPGLQQHAVTRAKGGPRFGFHVKQVDRVSLGADGQEVHPGDQLRFYVSASNPQHLAILSRDGAGVVSEYYPGNGQSRAIGRVQHLDLDSSVELDATLGREALWAVFCSEPFSTEALRRQLQQTGQIAPPVGCTTDRLTIQKKAQP